MAPRGLVMAATLDEQVEVELARRGSFITRQSGMYGRPGGSATRLQLSATRSATHCGPGNFETLGWIRATTKSRF
jgi:hypothetical protein